MTPTIPPSTKITDPKRFKHGSTPTRRKGYSQWIEWGAWYEAPTVDKKRFGPHAYATGGGTGECPCGCHMGNSTSGGPVDPFGACPLNPQATMAEPADPSDRSCQSDIPPKSNSMPTLFIDTVGQLMMCRAAIRQSLDCPLEHFKYHSCSCVDLLRRSLKP